MDFTKALIKSCMLVSGEIQQFMLIVEGKLFSYYVMHTTQTVICTGQVAQLLMDMERLFIE